MAKPIKLATLRRMAKGHGGETARDKATDRKQGIKEGSPLDKKLDSMGSRKAVKR